MQRFSAFAVTAAISALLLYLALDFINLATLRARFDQFELKWLLTGLAVLTVHVVLVAVRWHTLSPMSAVPPSGLNASRSTR